MISPATTSRSRGFTVVELSVVIVILMLAAALIVPNIISIQKSRSLKDLEGNVARLPALAQKDAIKSQIVVTLQLQGTDLVVQETPVSGSATTIKQVDLGQNLLPAAAQLNGKNSDPGTWIWKAYPDGTTDTGGIQFTEGSSTKSLILYADGSSTWSTAELPDVSLHQWPAGQLQLRVQ